MTLKEKFDQNSRATRERARAAFEDPKGTTRARGKALYQSSGAMPEAAQLIRTPAAVTTEPAAMLKTLDPALEATLQRQRQRIAQGEYTPVGILERIQLEPAGVPKRIVKNGRVMDNPLLADKKRSASLDWLKQGPLVGRSLDDQELLIIPPILDPPPIPDPHWKGPDSLYEMRDGVHTYIGDELQIEPDKIPQELSWFSWGVCELSGRKYLVFQPITQMLLIATPGGMPTFKAWQGGHNPATPMETNQSGFIIADWKHDTAGKHCCFLYDPDTKQGHVIFGTFQLRSF